MSELLAEARGLDDPASRAGSPWPPPAVMRPRSYSCKERDNGAIIPCPDEPGRLLSNRLKPRAEARRGDTQMNTRLFFLLALPLPGGPGGHAPLRATAARGHKPDGKLCLAGYLPQATASCHVARGDALPPRYCHTHEARAKVSTSSTPRPETLSGPETVTVARTPSGRNRKTAGPSAPHSTRPPPPPQGRRLCCSITIICAASVYLIDLQRDFQTGISVTTGQSQQGTGQLRAL